MADGGPNDGGYRPPWPDGDHDDIRVAEVLKRDHSQWREIVPGRPYADDSERASPFWPLFSERGSQSFNILWPLVEAPKARWQSDNVAAAGHMCTESITYSGGLSAQHC
jgi:hypothetical protein